MLTLEAENEPTCVILCRSRVGAALSAMSAISDCHAASSNMIGLLTPNSDRVVSGRGCVADAARSWLLTTRGSISLHVGSLSLSAEQRSTRADVEVNEGRGRSAIAGIMMSERRLLRSTGEEAGGRRALEWGEMDVRTTILETLTAEKKLVPLRESSNMFLQVLDEERTTLLREFRDTLETLLLVEAMDREELVASLLRRGMDPFRSPQRPQQQPLPTNAFQQQPLFTSGGSGAYRPGQQPYAPQGQQFQQTFNSSRPSRPPHSSRPQQQTGYYSQPLPPPNNGGFYYGQQSAPPSHYYPQDYGNYAPQSSTTVPTRPSNRYQPSHGSGRPPQPQAANPSYFPHGQV